VPRKEHEHPLLENEAADWAAAGVLVALAAVVCTLVAIPSLRDNVQRLDDAFLRTMESHRAGWLTAIAKVFDVLGSVKVTLPVRILAAAYLVFRRRWWHFAAFVSAIVLAEALTHVLKSSYGRMRPIHPLVPTSGASFPSGHAVATAVTAVALVIAFLPSGRQRAIWGTVAAVFAFLMALSRAYLAAHWLSDAVAGTLLGVTCALVPALIVEEIRDRAERREARVQERDARAGPPRLRMTGPPDEPAVAGSGHM
jgi:membrane-associated phospholipid phosphatase